MEVAVRRSREALAALLLVVAGYIAVCLPAKFWPHYYYLMIPSLVIALAMALGACVRIAFIVPRCRIASRVAASVRRADNR